MSGSESGSRGDLDPCDEFDSKVDGSLQYRAESNRHYTNRCSMSAKPAGCSPANRGRCPKLSEICSLLLNALRSASTCTIILLCLEVWSKTMARAKECVSMLSDLGTPLSDAKFPHGKLCTNYFYAHPVSTWPLSKRSYLQPNHTCHPMRCSQCAFRWSSSMAQ